MAVWTTCGGSGKTAAERIEMPFRGLTRMGSMNNVLLGCGGVALAQPGEYK